ncbi:MAG: histone deacetylase family protein [Pseudomonadota bacterium]
MVTRIYTDPVYAKHEMPRGHPESALRMGAVDAALKSLPAGLAEQHTAAPISFEAIARAHPSAYIERLDALVPETGMIALDPDTHAGPHSLIAARTASGSLAEAIDAVMDQEATNAFIASRPPGHHAERTRAMGFCLINHVAIGARHAIAVHGVERVAIIDFDVHHGNGTQDIFWDDPSVLYVSTHQSPHYPGTGAASETGAGNILNLPLSAGTDGARYRPIFKDHVVSAVDAFAPDLLILSAGFDAHRDDPLGDIRLTEDDFVWITQEMMDCADRSCGGRLVSLLEGGYDLAALGRCVAAHVTTLASANS